MNVPLEGVNRHVQALKSFLNLKGSNPVQNLDTSVQGSLPLFDSLQPELRILRGERLWGTYQAYQGLTAGNAGATTLVQIGKSVAQSSSSNMACIVERAQLTMSPQAAIATVTWGYWWVAPAAISGLSMVGTLNRDVRWQGIPSTAAQTPQPLANGTAIANALFGGYFWTGLVAQPLWPAFTVDMLTAPYVLLPNNALTFNVVFHAALGADLWNAAFSIEGYERTLEPAELIATGTS